MPAHLVIDRAHHGPRLLQTFATREDADEAREELVAESADLERALYVVIVDDARLSEVSRRNGALGSPA